MLLTRISTEFAGRAGVLLASGLLTMAGGVAIAKSAESQGHGSATYVVSFDHWTDADERDFGEFVQAIGDSGCPTVDACLKGAWNPFHASDSPDVRFYSDCAQFPYVLRAYFAWKRGLPFSYESGVAARGGGPIRAIRQRAISLRLAPTCAPAAPPVISF